MPIKKKAGTRKRDNEADLAELERLRKQVAEQSKALEAEEARREEESQGKRQISSRRQRTLVRWDVDTDIRLLLAIQYACNKLSVKIPWKEVAEVLGEKFTEGAIVQHLSKLRAKREEQDKPNPPPLKRAASCYNKNDKNKKEALSPPKDEPPSTRSGKRRRRSPSVEESDDDVYPIKKKQPTKNKKKGKVSAAPKLRGEREQSESGDSQKLLCVGAEWLRDFAGDDCEVDDESASSEENEDEDSTESSHVTTQAAKKSKIVTLKLGRERLASVDRYLGGSATFREPMASTNPLRAITNMPPRQPSYRTYMHSVGPFSPDPTTLFGNNISYPSNGPSPFDIPISDADLAGACAFDDVDLTAPYSQFDIPSELQFDPMCSYLNTSGFDNQFIPDDELFASVPDVEPPRYYGYEGEEVQEF
ncbi:uncharacterized protein N7518_008907 [Penicillium psychrosexuale]|uniref:uncharacterized protein n=1 Tax=Penicillium psychrosexuale TaxID=1002107 RepID=UPI002544F527|nr:uncharacterized protein N7518_008907 [Penicillium psychrosexuale]KAJ5791896.1 hypothetical protein N7518_008907 [Penicillium psychrosexuale]